MPLIPRIRDGYILIPQITFLLTYFTEGCVLFWVYGTMVITMGIENIPSEYVVPTVVTIVVTAVLLYMVFYLVAFQQKKSKTLELQAKAIESGGAVSEIELKRVENFHIIYKIAMFLGIIIVSSIAFTVYATVIAGHVVDLAGAGHEVSCCVYAALSTAVVFALFDNFVGRPIADGTFKTNVLDPLEAAVVEEFQQKSKSADTAGYDKEKVMKALAAIGDILSQDS